MIGLTAQSMFEKKVKEEKIHDVKNDNEELSQRHEL